MMRRWSILVLMVFLWPFLWSGRASAQDAYAGVWRSGNDPYYLWAGVDWNSFKSKWEELSGKNYRLVDLQTYMQGGQRKYTGVWRGGSDGHYLWVGVDWDSFKAKWEELAKQNLRLTICRTYVDGGQRKWAGVWREGKDGHYLWAGVDWNSFKAKWEELSGKGLRLVDFDTYVEGGTRKYIGVWREGKDGHYLWVGVDWNSFKAKWEELAPKNLRLILIRTYEEGGQRKYAGVWREGNDGHYLWVGVDWENFTSKWHELAKQGLRLVSIQTYGGCNGDCPNHLVSNGAYNYTISGDTTTYHWPVDEDGGNKYVRLSAVQINAKPFVLPFSNTSVIRWNGWLYSLGSWHHAVDYAIVGLAQTFEVKAAAAGKVIFVGWDNWSGNTVVISHNAGGVQDAFRTIYMHLRNGPANDCAKSWSNTVPSLDDPTKFKGHLTSTGCAQSAANRNPTTANWGTNSQTIQVAVNQQVTAGQRIGWAGDTGPGGNGGNDATTNTHLHIFFAAKDATDNQFYFIDPYGIYSIPNCYPTATTGATGGICARYPIAWKGGAPQYP
jgi:hypothetical protein